MEVGIAVEAGYFLIFKREAYIQSLKFTQVSIDIFILKKFNRFTLV